MIDLCMANRYKNKSYNEINNINAKYNQGNQW